MSRTLAILATPQPDRVAARIRQSVNPGTLMEATLS